MVTVAVHFGRSAPREDWTRGQIYTLSQRAEKVLEGLKRPIDVTVLVPANIGGGRSNPLRAELHEVLMRMGQVGKVLRVRSIDPDRERQESERMLDDFGLSGKELADGVVLIRSGQGAELRRAYLLPRDLVTYAHGPDAQVNGPRVKAFRGEEALLSKFMEVTESKRTSLCYSQGHEEPELDDLEPYAGYAHLKDLLQDANFELKQADFSVGDGLSACDVLLIAGPGMPFLESHRAEVARFLQRGGDALVMAGAVMRRGEAEIVHHGLEDIFAEYGIRFGNRVVLDPHPMVGASPLLAFTLNESWIEHPATTSLLGRPVSLIQARELSVQSPAQILIESSLESWGELQVDDFQYGIVPRYDPEKDRRGPIPLAAASERQGSRIIVIASDQFALNAWLRNDVAYDHNRDMILNLLSWVSQRPDLLGIRAREREHVKLVLQDQQLERMTLMCLLGLPGFAIGCGILVLWRRRR